MQQRQLQSAADPSSRAVINFFKQDIFFSLSKKEAVKAWILSAIRKEKKKAGDISFVFCNDKFLLALNKKFL